MGDILKITEDQMDAYRKFIILLFDHSWSALNGQIPFDHFWSNLF